MLTIESLRRIGAPYVTLWLAIFAACILGVSIGPVGYLANIWPANAVMLGLMIRMPVCARPPGWIIAGTAYMAADLITGGGLLASLLLNTGNIISVGTAYFVYSRLPSDLSRLQEPTSMLHLILVTALAALAAGFVGAILYPFLLNGGVIAGWTLWFTGEFVNYILILPVILTAPALKKITKSRLATQRADTAKLLAPLAALLISCVAGVVIGGPGAMSFPIPALLWCALVYTVFPTAVLTLLFSLWTLSAVSVGILPSLAPLSDELAISSARLGISLVAVAPLMLAIVMASRNKLLLRVQHQATHDSLTGILNRGAFLVQAQQKLDTQKPVSVMMIDADYFKQVNDKYGHAAGDHTLMVLSARLRSCLRKGDIIGRLGGEEFGAIMSSQSEAEARAAAERIRQSMDNFPITLSEGQQLTLTVSIGVVVVPHPASEQISRLLVDADKALYSAKKKGRNQVEIFNSKHHG